MDNQDLTSEQVSQITAMSEVEESAGLAEKFKQLSQQLASAQLTIKRFECGEYVQVDSLLETCQLNQRLAAVTAERDKLNRDMAELIVGLPTEADIDRLAAYDAALAEARGEMPLVEELRGLVKRNGCEWDIEDIKNLLSAIDSLKLAQATSRNAIVELHTALANNNSALNSEHNKRLAAEARALELEKALQVAISDIESWQEALDETVGLPPECNVLPQLRAALRSSSEADGELVRVRVRFWSIDLPDDRKVQVGHDAEKDGFLWRFTNNGAVTQVLLSGVAMSAMVVLYAKLLREQTRVEEALNPHHPDDIAADHFASAMKAKLAKKRCEGRGGWEDPEVITTSRLWQMMEEHVHKGDTVDVANFAMMIWHRNRSALAQPQPVQEPK